MCTTSVVGYSWHRCIDTFRQPLAHCNMELGFMYILCEVFKDYLHNNVPHYTTNICTAY